MEEVEIDMDIGTSDPGGWVLQNISPTTFNVISDLLAQTLTGLLLLALGVAYPYLMWRSILRGGGIALDSLIAPLVLGIMYENALVLDRFPHEC